MSASATLHGMASTTITGDRWDHLSARERERFDLEPHAVAEAMRLDTPELVAEVFAFAKVTIAEELARQARLDAKANLLLGAIGVSVSVVTVLMPRASLLTGVLLAVAASLAVAAALCAAFALRIGHFKRVPDAAIFDASTLERADNEGDPRKAVSLYQRSLLPAVWEAHVTMVRANDRRAPTIAWGQWIFAVALCFAVLGGVLIAATPTP